MTVVNIIFKSSTVFHYISLYQVHIHTHTHTHSCIITHTRTYVFCFTAAFCYIYTRVYYETLCICLTTSSTHSSVSIAYLLKGFLELFQRVRELEIPILISVITDTTWIAKILNPGKSQPLSLLVLFKLNPHVFVFSIPRQLEMILLFCRHSGSKCH